MSAMEQLDSFFQAVEAQLGGNAIVLLATFVLGGVLLLVSLHKSKYSYYSAPSPPVRAPYWAFGNVEMVERYEVLWP
jgi:hypothetical protein